MVWQHSNFLTVYNLNSKHIFLTAQSLILPWNAGEHTQMTAEDRKRMKDAGSSKVSHIPRKPSQRIDVTTPVITHVVEHTFWNHCNDYDLLSNRTRFSFSLFNGGKIMLYSKFLSPTDASPVCITDAFLIATLESCPPYRFLHEDLPYNHLLFKK